MQEGEVEGLKRAGGSAGFDAGDDGFVRGGGDGAGVGVWEAHCSYWRC